MAEFPTYEQMVKNVAEKALDEFLYHGKSIREWVKIIVEQEPKTGHWIERPHGFKCSKCLIVHSHTSIFCPSCGAKMIE